MPKFSDNSVIVSTYPSVRMMDNACARDLETVRTMSDRKEQDAVITKMMMKDGRFQEAGKEEGYRKNIRTGNKEKQTGSYNFLENSGLYFILGHACSIFYLKKHNFVMT